MPPNLKIHPSGAHSQRLYSTHHEVGAARTALVVQLAEGAAFLAAVAVQVVVAVGHQALLARRAVVRLVRWHDDGWMMTLLSRVYL